MKEQTIKTFYDNLIDQAYDLEEKFNLKEARSLYKKVKIHAKMVDNLISELENSVDVITYNKNEEIKTKIENQLNYYREVKVFNDRILRFELKTQVGFQMFIKDIINY